MIGDKKISVIVPVYNVELYLRRCVDSILSQTYTNLEVLLVDDGSTDKSTLICKEYAQRDNRVILLQKVNGGQSSARNLALNYPLKGDYIAFVDSDDWIDLDTYEYCMQLVEKYGVESVQYEVYMTNSPENHPVQPVEHVELYEGKDVLQYFMIRSTKASGGYSIWGGIYKRDLLDGLRFRDGKINEDIDYKFKVMQRCQSVAVSNQKKYNYFQSGETTSTGGLRVRDFQLREAADLLCDMASKENYGSIAFLGRVKKARTAFSLLCKIAYFGIVDSSINKEQTVKELIPEHRSNLGLLLKAPLPLSRKLLAIIFAMNYRLAELIIHLVKKL